MDLLNQPPFYLNSGFIIDSISQLEVDKTLLEAKLTAERKFLFDEEKKCEKIKDYIIQIEEQYMMRREKVRVTPTIFCY